MSSRLRLWRSPLASIYLSVFLFISGEAALHVLVSPYLARELELGPAAIGLVVGIFGFASLLARLPTGAAYTRARMRRLLLLGGTLSATAFALVPVVPGPVPFAALMALDGFGWSVATTTQLAAVVAARPPGMRLASALGWYSGFTGLGHTVGATAGAFSAQRLGFDATFLLLAGVVVLGTVTMVRRAAAVEPPEVERPPSELRGGHARAVWHGLAGMPVAVWAGVLVMVYINFVNGIQTTFHPVLVLAAGLTLTQVGLLASCRSWASSVTRMGSGALFGRIDASRLTAPLLLVGAASIVLIPSVQSSFLWQVPLFLATGLARGLLRVSGSADAFSVVGDRDREHGLAAALLHSGLDAGKIAGPLVGGVVAELIGLARMFQVLPLALLAVYLVLHVAARRAVRSPAVADEGPR